MLFSLFTLLSTMSTIYAMTTQETEQRDLNPLILPLFGSPETLIMKTWHWVGNDQRSITLKPSFFQVNYALKEIWKGSYEQEIRNVVFGSWKYVNAGSESPSSALTFETNEMTKHSASRSSDEFAIRQFDGYDTFLRRLLRQFDKKMISFWWDSTTPLRMNQGPQKTIAELAIGGVNPSRFVAGTEMNIRLTFQTASTSYWETIIGTTVRVGNRDINWDKRIDFALKIESIIPMVVYDAITKPLRDEMRYTVGLMKGYGRNINGGIMQYHDFNEPIFEFDCKDGPKLLPLRIGELTIPPRAMYEQTSPDKCKMTLHRNDDRAGQSKITIGIDIIRHFYVSIIYDNWTSPTLQFATRVEGQSPPPPMGPPLSASSSGRS